MIYIFSGCGCIHLSLHPTLDEKERSKAAALNVPVIKQAIANDFVSPGNIIRWSRLNLNFYAVMSIKI